MDKEVGVFTKGLIKMTATVNGKVFCPGKFTTNYLEQVSKCKILCMLRSHVYSIVHCFITNSDGVSPNVLYMLH